MSFIPVNVLATIVVFGFPITAAFVGLDVMFSYFDSDQYAAIILLT